MKKTIYILLAAAALAAGFLYFSQPAPSNTPQKVECSADPDCTIKPTDCTCGGPIYSCVSREYPPLECSNGSLACPNKQNPRPDSCSCINNACTGNSCTNLCADWKKTGYSAVIKSVELLQRSGCCTGIEGCTDRCAGGPQPDEGDLSCTGAASPAAYVQSKCKGYVSNESILEARLPFVLKKDAILYSTSCFYAGEPVLKGYAFAYEGRYCELDAAAMGFLFAPISPEEAVDYYRFSVRNLSEEKQERTHEPISDFGSFISNRSTCNITTQPPSNRTRLSTVPGGFNITLLDYLPLKKEAVYEQAVVYRNGNIERTGSAVISAC